MAITIRIPQNYAARIISNIRNTGNSARMQDAAVRKLNVQPDGSILVQTSADNQYDAVQEVFAQNLGIPVAAIRGFDSRITSEGEKGVSPESIGGTEIDPQDIAAPITGAGDLEDLAFEERRERGLVDIGAAAPFAPAQVLTPSFYTEIDEEDDAAKYGVAPGLALGGSGVDDGGDDGSTPWLNSMDEGFTTDGATGLGNDNVKPDISVDMPANLPQFWKERYNQYLGLSENQQQAILDNQLQNFDDLNAWAISTSSFDLEKEPINFEGFPVTGFQDMMNIFYSDPSQYIVEQDIIGTTGYDENGNPIEGIVGSQQSLSPAAQAALQAFSTQRGAESSDLASRFGTSTPFGAIAGLGGSSADAVGLAELQARAGVSNPFAALGTGSTIGDIGTILRGGLTTQQQADLAGLQARGGLSVEEQLALSGMQARGGLTVEQQSALAGMQARGGLTAEEQLTLSGLQARGGLSAQERLAEQRLGILPSLFQATPQALGGLSRVLGGEEALKGALTPFFGGVPAQQQPFAPAPAMRQGQPTPVNLFSSGTAQQPTPSFRPTLGDYQGAGMFEQGGLQAEAGMAGQELPKFLGEVSPQGTSTSRGGLGATTTGRFTY